MKIEERRARLLRDFSKSLEETYDPYPFQAMSFVRDVFDHLEWISEQMESDAMPVAEKIAVARVVHGLKEFRDIIGHLQDAELDRLSESS